MKKKDKFDVFKILVGSIVATSIVITPWLNVDSLVVPKLVLLFSTAMYLFPYCIVNIRFFVGIKQLRVLIILSTLVLIQIILVMIASESPFEQQFFGRSGRGFGFLSEFSFIVFLLVSAFYVRISNLALLSKGILIVAIFSSFYSILQSIGLDAFDWYTRTNGIIGTFGNPNFQASYSALAIAPALSLFFNSGLKFKLLSFSTLSLLIYTIYLCQSTQGYLVSLIVILSLSILYTWHNNKILFKFLVGIAFSSIIAIILGMLNSGPLSSLLYKNSVISRYEFFRTAIATTKDNLTFGVGLDSFGDYSTIYKSAKDAAGINEYTDSAHNYILNYAANGGIPLALLYISINLLAIVCFFKLTKVNGKFNLQIAVLFSMWMGFQAQALISPATIPIQLLGVTLSGALIGVNAWSSNENLSMVRSFYFTKPLSVICLFISLILTFPYYNVDRLQLKSLNSNDGLLAVKSALSYPESSLRYQRIGTRLLQSNLGEEALKIGKAATAFNPNSISAWGLILANSTAPISERKEALRQLKRLDPYDKKIKDIEKLFNQELSR